MWEKYGKFYKELKPKWNNLMTEIEANQDFNIHSIEHQKEDAAFLEIYKKYSEKKRHYHNLLHILACLKEFKEVKDLAEHPLELQAGIIGHDVIYNTRARGNEQQSADYMQNLFLKLGSSHDFAKKVHDLILLTKHDKVPKIIDGKIIVDIDLSIFGKSEKEFDEYDKNIRKEYSWVSEEDFRNSRAKVLQSFLNRKKIYATNFFREKYEERARINLKRVIKDCI